MVPQKASHESRAKRMAKELAQDFKQAQRGLDEHQRRMSRTQLASMTIMRHIVELEYAPGMTITEAEVGEDVKMSRTPVREALMLLAAEGLVYPKPGAGYLVMPLTLRDVRGILAHWRRLMTDAVMTAAKVGLSSYDSMDMMSYFDRDWETSDSDEQGDIVDRFFVVQHLILHTNADDFLGRDIERLFPHLERVLRLTVGPDVSILAGERPLVRALMDADPERARDVFLASVAAIESAVVDRLLGSDTLLAAQISFPSTRKT